MAAPPLVNGLRTLFFVLGSAMVATLIYTISVYGSPFRMDLLTPWLTATLIDFYIIVVPLAAWVSYKESNWISSTLWIILLICFGSIATSFYIFLQFLKLSPEEAFQDPIYHVLLHPSDKDGTKRKERHPPVVILRILFSLLGCFMLGTLIYTFVIDGSPIRQDILTPWMTATVIDLYINIVALSIWIAYKETNWISAFLWIILLICIGSTITCAYIVKELFQITSEDPVYLILVKREDSAENRYERPELYKKVVP